jgi:hypothetical protein
MECCQYRSETLLFNKKPVKYPAIRLTAATRIRYRFFLKKFRMNDFNPEVFAF